jgi:hypothetical protein
MPKLPSMFQHVGHMSTTEQRRPQLEGRTVGLLKQTAFSKLRSQERKYHDQSDSTHVTQCFLLLPHICPPHALPQLAVCLPFVKKEY